MPVPLKIDSNQTGLSYAEETALKTLGGSPTWYALEPNSYSEMGADYKLIARSPITNTRQKLKGIVTDLDAKAGFTMDITKRNLQRLLQGFFWRDMLEKSDTQPLNGTQITLTAITTTQFQAASGLDAIGLEVGHLCFAVNTGVGADDGLFHVTAVAAGAVTTDKALTANPAPPANAAFQACGFQFASGDLEIDLTGAVVTLITTAQDLTLLGLQVGEWIWLGGDGSSHQFATSPGANLGFARVKSIAAHAVVLDITNFTAATDAGTGKTIQIFFGKVLQNAINPTDIKRRSYTLERTLGNDGTGVQAEYIEGCIANQVTFDFKEASKLELTLDFVGLDIFNRTGSDGLYAGTRIPILGEDAFNTSLDQVMSRLYIVDPTSYDPTPLFAYASDAKLVINNGVKPNKALGVLGAFEASASYFDVSGTLTAYFQTVTQSTAIRDSDNVGLTIGMAKQNYGFVFDIPLLALGGGINKVEQDKPIMVDLTQASGKCPAGYTALMSFFAYLPTVAMP